MSCHSHTETRKITSDTGNNKVKLLFGLIAAHFIMWCVFHFGMCNSCYCCIKFIPMSCKGSMTACSSMKSLSRESGTGSACIVFDIQAKMGHNHKFVILKTHISRHEGSLHGNMMWNHNVVLVRKSHQCECSHVNTP